MCRNIQHLVLLPGLDGTGILFRPFLAGLPKGFGAKVVAYPPSKPLSLTELGELVIEQLPPRDFILLAESFSGLVALSILDRIAGRVRGVVFCAAFATPPRPTLLNIFTSLPAVGAMVKKTPDLLLKEFGAGPDAPPALISLLREALSSVAPEVLARRLAIVGRRQKFGKLANIPCYYIQATQDRLVPSSAAEWFRDHFEQFELKRVHGPHFLLQARPEECGDLVAKIVSEL
jgi:pimeloyl-ACP methyl ester carboxylesterase